MASSVTLATFDMALTFPKKRNRDAVEAAHASGVLSLRLGARLVEGLWWPASRRTTA